MSLDRVPAKAEVMRWNSNSLADFMKKLNVQGCEKVVKRHNINGAQFLQMTAIEVQMFPKIHVPIISNILSKINRNEERKGFGNRSVAPIYPKQDFIGEEETSSDESSENGDDEEHSWEEEDDIYVCPLSEFGDDDERENREGSDDDYEAPPSADTQEGSRRLPDSACSPAPTDRILPRPQRPVRARGSTITDHPPPIIDHPTQWSLEETGYAKPPIPQVDRSMKPGQSACYKADLTKSREGNPSKLPEMKPPDRANIRHAAFQPNLQPTKIHSSHLGQTQGLDPMWYRGQVTRSQAEVALRQVNKDGAFVVRDASKGLFEQPYTLMVFKQGKVYNIQIRNQCNSYSLGTGLNKTESFPGVKEMINHHTHTPLLLIDAMCPAAPRHCCLLHPVDF